MYLDIQKDPKRDGKWTMFVFLLVVVFMMFCATCQGQCNSRVKIENRDFPHLIRIHDCENIVYPIERNGQQEKIKLGVYADSVKLNTYYMAIYVYYPKDIVILHSELIVGFKGDGIEILKATHIDTELSYVEYQVTNEQYKVFLNGNYEYISFGINGYGLAIEDDYNKDYFKKFFAKL